MFEFSDCESLVDVNNFKAPCNLIKKEMIVEFLKVNNMNFSDEEINYLSNLKVDIWKYVARNKINYSHWHNINSFFNKQKYYDLFDIAEKILEIRDDVEYDYDDYIENKKRNLF